MNLKKKNTTNTIFKNLDTEIDAYLLYDNTIMNSDLFYLTNFKSEDPFFYIGMKNNKEILLISEMEKERAKRESSISTIKTYSDYNLKLLIQKYGLKLAYIHILEKIFKDNSIKKIGIPYNFPSIYYYLLKKETKLEYIIIESPIKKIRYIKTKEEIKYIQQSVKAAEYAMNIAVNSIKNSVIKDNYLYDRKTNKEISGNKILLLIRDKLMKKGYYGLNTIVSCGYDSETPHGITKGKLRANKPIIIDIFPRSLETMYYGDMTRTIIRGKASD